MADPRLTDMMDRQKKDNRSPLMKAKALAPEGGVTNWCPYGCENSELDEQGYCKHLVGTTNDKKFYEPMVWDATRQRRVTRVKMVEDKDGRMIPQLEPCLPGDHFEQITISYRVYRKTEALIEQKPKAK